MDQGERSADELARMMLELQDQGCHNINFVTPTHFVPQILEALVLASERGLDMPLVYNSGGYDSVETLRLLDGIFDIYMPDMKYGSDKSALKYSQAPEYIGFMRAAIKEMHRQVGDLVVDEDGVAVRGLMVRHLVLPDGLAGTSEVVRFLAREDLPAPISMSWPSTGRSTMPAAFRIWSDASPARSTARPCEWPRLPALTRGLDIF